MSTLRSAWLCAALGVLTACASGGSSNERTSDQAAAVANMNLGAGYLRQGRYDLAIERLQRALMQDPRLVEAHSTIAFAYDQIGALMEAETHYLRATELDRNSAQAANAYAVFLCNRQNRWSDAEPYFLRAAESATYATPEVPLTNAGVCAKDAGELEKATESFRAALARNPTFRDALTNMMEISYQGGNFMQARAFVQRYLAAHAATAPVLLTCVNVERELNDRAAADRCTAQLRSGFADSPELRQLEQQQTRNGR
jgi:type IV pilus assembly protein PilF